MKKIYTFMMLLSLTGCNLAEKLSTVGETPELSQIQDPTRVKGYQPISMPMPTASTQQIEHSPSLWQTGSRAFFKDQRAGKIGDVITVIIAIDQSESIEMTPSIERKNSGTSTVTNALGLERKAEKFFPAKQRPQSSILADIANPSWLNVGSDPTLSGSAKYNVNDKIKFKIAATVLQILPNGNMVILGRQEIRLVNEIREIQVKGIIRREDISSSNMIHGEKISELRISYGGRGELSDMQAFPWGQQVMNKILPF
ncbi:MAG: flagellar basal body L-ring protein FlgH [Pseudomonadota bacterium]